MKGKKPSINEYRIISIKEHRRLKREIRFLREEKFPDASKDDTFINTTASKVLGELLADYMTCHPRQKKTQTINMNKFIWHIYGLKDKFNITKVKE